MKTKKFFVIGALAAVVLSSTSALAVTEYPSGAIWNHGTTGLLGGGYPLHTKVTYFEASSSSVLKGEKWAYGTWKY